MIYYDPEYFFSDAVSGEIPEYKNFVYSNCPSVALTFGNLIDLASWMRSRGRVRFTTHELIDHLDEFYHEIGEGDNG